MVWRVVGVPGELSRGRILIKTPVYGVGTLEYYIGVRSLEVDPAYPHECWLIRSALW